MKVCGWIALWRGCMMVPNEYRIRKVAFSTKNCLVYFGWVGRTIVHCFVRGMLVCCWCFRWFSNIVWWSWWVSKVSVLEWNGSFWMRHSPRRQMTPGERCSGKKNDSMSGDGCSHMYEPLAHLHVHPYSTCTFTCTSTCSLLPVHF